MGNGTRACLPHARVDRGVACRHRLRLRAELHPGAIHSAMIERVQYRNFKSLQALTVDLRPFTLLVGGNGSGKTSILQGLHDLLCLASAPPRAEGGRPAGVFSGARDPARVGRQNPEGWLEVACVGGGLDGYGVRASMVPERAPRFLVWKVDGGIRQELRYPGADLAEESAFFHSLQARGIGGGVYLRISAKTAAEPHYAEAEDAHIEQDGYGLASVLQRLQLLRDGRFEAIEAALVRIVPSIRRLRAVPHKVRRPERLRVTVDGAEGWFDQLRERTGARIEAEVLGGGWVPADLLSEGTMVVLGLLTVLSDQAPRTVLLDDLDQALHPSAQGRLMAELRELLRERPSVQVVASTHSPFLVDHCAIEEVRVVRLDEAGATRCLPLSAHPKWAKRSGFLRPGEFWSGVGEPWVGG